MAERPGPEGGSDDLFEDLDRFFSSIDEEDWPDPIEGGPRAPTGPQEPAGPEPTREIPAASETPASDEPAVSEQPSVPVEPLEPAEEPEPEAAPTAAPADAGPGPGDGSDLPSAEWSRLRDVLGEDEGDEDEDEFPFSGTRGMTTEESLFGYAGPEGDEDETGEDFARMSGMWETGKGGGERDEEESAESERAELTLDDLRKAPPQYRDLPGPPEESDRPGRSGSSFAGEPAGSAAAGSESRSFGEPEGEPFDAADLEGEPSLADVEAAADRVAGEFGTAEPDAGGTTRPGQDQEPASEPDWLSGDYLEPTSPPPPGGVEEDLLGDLAEPRQPRRVKVGEPESLLGPAWEDPTAHTVSGESRGPSIGGRDLPVAFLSAVVLALVALGLLAIKAWAFAVLAGAVVLFAQFELYTTTQRRGFHPATALGLVLGGLTIAGAYFKGEASMPFALALAVVLTFFWYMAAAPKAREGSVANIGVTLLGLVYVPFLASFVILVLTAASGRALMLAVIGLTFLYDVVAFFIGSWYGSRPLAKTISPKKSWEGVAAATIVTILISIAFVSPIGPMTVTRAIGLALVVAVMAPLGDLAESALKRDLGVKDMGSIMPGHGGLLDRIDSLLFVAPAAFYFFRLVF